MLGPGSATGGDGVENPGSSEYLLIFDAAKVLDRTPSTLRRWADQGMLPCLRASTGVRLFERRVVEQFAAELRERETARRG